MMSIRTPTVTMFALVFLCVCSRAFADAFGTGEHQFDIEFVEVGEPGNSGIAMVGEDRKHGCVPADEGEGVCPPPVLVGGVDYVYRIGKFEVSRDMIEKANAEGGLNITMHGMHFVAGGPRENMPAMQISWNEAARFTNWLNESKGFAVPYKFNVKPGDATYNSNANVELWEPNDDGYDEDNPIRNSLARYFLPTIDEWYKAGYYDPKLNGDEGAYWSYPTGSDAEPLAVSAGEATSTAVYNQSWEQGPADVMQAGGLSPFGAMGLAGNVYEWQENAIGPITDGSLGRNVFGGAWDLTSEEFLLESLGGSNLAPTGEDGSIHIGFRVASIPEPTSRLMSAIGLLSLLGWRPSRRHGVRI